ncbi:glycosyltransferase family 4 protein [Chryseobacterium sp. DT-3]|uniref:glycosyltransferase family 4 protein n=1 Tax=Chryseobacterium sp. DT-3 TaxID=3396164 RepID=UPI003F1A6E98
MRIIIDNSNLFAGGGLQVAASFVNDLKRINNDNDYYIINSPNCHRQFEVNLFPENFHFIELSDEEYNSKRKRIKKMMIEENRIKPDCIFTVFGPSYHKSKFPKIVGFAWGYVLYLDSPFYKRLRIIESIKYKVLNALKVFFFNRNSDALIFETKNAQEIYSKNYNSSIKSYVVSNTLNSIFNKKEQWKDILIPSSGFNLLCLSANYPHKNLEIIPNVIDEILKIDPDFDFKFHISLTEENLKVPDVYKKYINYLGRVDLNKLPSLFSKMDSLFMPTLLETFSTTYLEAMFMKVPIITSDMSFSRDICSDAAIYCDPVNSRQYAENIVNLSKDPFLKERLINNGINNLLRFGNSLDRTKEYLRIIEENI